MARCNYRVKWSGMAVLAAVMLLVSSPVGTAKKFSDWSAPVNLGPVVNSPSEELLPEISQFGSPAIIDSMAARASGTFIPRVTCSTSERGTTPARSSWIHTSNRAT